MGRLVISQRDPELNIAYADGSERAMITDSSQLEYEIERGYVEARSRFGGSATDRSRTM